MLTAAIAGNPPILYITSTDAVDAMVLAFHSVDGALEWATRGDVITLHPRIVRRLNEAGFRNISVTSTDAETVLANIESFIEARQQDK